MGKQQAHCIKKTGRVPLKTKKTCLESSPMEVRVNKRETYTVMSQPTGNFKTKQNGFRGRIKITSLDVSQQFSRGQISVSAVSEKKQHTQRIFAEPHLSTICQFHSHLVVMDRKSSQILIHSAGCRTV